MDAIQIIVLGTAVVATGGVAAYSWFRKPKFNPELQKYLKRVQSESLHLSVERRQVLNRLRDYVVHRVNKGNQASLLFLCAENSGRSLLAQTWLEVLTRAYELPELLSYSGGTQPDTLPDSLKEALRKAGMEVEEGKDTLGRKIKVSMGPSLPALHIFSKLFDHVENPQRNFGVVTTDNFTECFLDSVPGAQVRLALPFEAATSSQEAEALSLAMAAEMMYLVREVKRALDPKFIHEAGLLRYTQLKTVVQVPSHTVAA